MTASTNTATPPPAPSQPMMMAGGSMPPPPMMMGGAAMPPPPPPPMMMGGGYSPTPMANGGTTGGGMKKNPFKEFFGDINMVEAGILALGVATFLYAIYYYKFEMKMTKTGFADLNARVQKLEANETARAAKESNVNAVGKMRMRKRVMI